MPNRYSFTPYYVDSEARGHSARLICGSIDSVATSKGLLRFMWCGHCHQDVPAGRDARIGRAICPRCKQPFASKSPQPAVRICDDGLALDEPIIAAAVAPPIRKDDWAARQQVRNLNRELRRPTPTRGITARGPLDRLRIDPPRDFFAQLEQATSPSASAASATLPHAIPAAPIPTNSLASQIVAWVTVITGTVALGCGMGGIAWTLSSGQFAHWHLAMGLTLAGQGTLILGLVLVASRLWRSSRHASNKLQDVHARLLQLQSTADALAASRGGATGFYADLARSASPNVLLANLKGQVDLLASRVAANS